MTNMRKLINLMEGVMAVPGLSEDGTLEKWQLDAIATVYISKLSSTSQPDKAIQDTIDSLYAGGVISSKQIPEVKQYLADYNQDEIMPSDIDNDDDRSSENRMLGIYEKSSSEKQARFMAAAAHDPKFAKKVGIDQNVAKEFNKADTGTEQLSKAMKKVKEDESDMQTASTASVDDADASFDASQAGATEIDETKKGPQVATCRQSNPAAARDACAMEGMYESIGPAIHTFPDSGDAYDATQTGQWYDDATDSQVEVKDGDILVIPSEGVVGLCSTWPVAVTKNPGKLHGMKPEYGTPEDIAEVTKLPLENVQAAFQKAQELGFETVGNIKEDLNNGYRDVEVANGEDFFPNGADGPVVKKVGPSGARQGDNPEQKSMQSVQVDETHKELVYAYRKFLNESKKSDSKKKLSESENKIIHVKHITLDKNGKPVADDLYTSTDGQGRYPLVTDGSVFWGSKDNPHIHTLDGEPHSSGKDLSLFSLDGRLGLYDENFKLVREFNTVHDFLYDYREDPDFMTPYRIVL